MAPFVPPPAREAPYKAFPPASTPLKLKLWICWQVYLIWQVQGLLFGLLFAAFTYFPQMDRFRQDAGHRHYVIFMSAAIPVLFAAFGAIGAGWRYMKICIADLQNQPPPPT